MFPDFELNVDVASEVLEGCADAVPFADCIIDVSTVALGDVDAELPTANLGCIRHSWSKLRSALIGTRSRQTGLRCGRRRLLRRFGCWMVSFFEFRDCVLSSLIFSSRQCFWSRARAV